MTADGFILLQGQGHSVNHKQRHNMLGGNGFFKAG